jgi:DNA phosphorothioation-dependent restriction protein DptG
MKQKKDREELKTMLFMNGVSCDNVDFLVDDLYHYFQSYTQKKVEEANESQKKIIRQWYENHSTNWEVDNLVDDLFGREFLLSLHK